MLDVLARFFERLSGDDVALLLAYLVAFMALCVVLDVIGRAVLRAMKREPPPPPRAWRRCPAFSGNQLRCEREASHAGVHTAGAGDYRIHWLP